MDHQSEDVKRAFATIRQIDNGNLWMTFLVIIALDHNGIERVYGPTIRKAIEALTGEGHQASDVDRWLGALMNEYHLITQHDDDSPGDEWKPSEKGSRFVDLVIEDELLERMAAIIDGQDGNQL
ncbi:hypothetical protein [Halalkalicoccus salilacus]|uniref:hypothetical protein n=1 Tax=Halalkalicoccus salilacus TaxID=3117459 RepID=UPI00300F30EC